MIQIIFSILLITLSITAQAKLDSKMVAYGDGKYEGYLVQPEGLKKDTPALLIVHNWMGVTEETKKQANRFADLGYIVFAVDVYGKSSRPKDASEAGQLAKMYKTNRPMFRDRLSLGLDYLKTVQYVKTNQIGAAGYCFGGTGVIELGRSGAPLKAIISFHGGLDSPTPEDGKNIKGELLVHHGEIDPFVKSEDIAAFESELKKYKVKYSLIKYPGAVHSFTEVGAGDDVKKGAAYNASADEKSFEATKKFLKKVLK